MTHRLGDLIVILPFETQYAYAFDSDDASAQSLVRITAAEKMHGIVVGLPAEGVNGGEIVVATAQGRRLSFHPNDVRVISRICFRANST